MCGGQGQGYGMPRMQQPNMGMQKPMNFGGNPNGFDRPVTAGWGTPGSMNPGAAPPQTGGMQPPPTQWQPSYGGSAPQPFMPSGMGGGAAPYMGGAKPMRLQDGGGQPVPQQQAPSYMPSPNFAQAQQPQVDAYANWQKENSSLIRPQQDMGRQAWEAQNPQAKAGNFTTPVQPMPPQPANSQAGQATSHWGPQFNSGGYGQFGWQPTFFPGQNEYIVQSLNGGRAPWINQVDPNNMLDSIGRLSGNPFNPSQWSR